MIPKKTYGLLTQMHKVGEKWHLYLITKILSLSLSFSHKTQNSLSLANM